MCEPVFITICITIRKTIQKLNQFRKRDGSVSFWVMTLLLVSIQIFMGGCAKKKGAAELNAFLNQNPTETSQPKVEVQAPNANVKKSPVRFWIFSSGVSGGVESSTSTHYSVTRQTVGSVFGSSQYSSLSFQLQGGIREGF